MDIEKKINRYADELLDALMEFVKRATKEGATPEEIAALPDIASTPCRVMFPY